MQNQIIVTLTLVLLTACSHVDSKVKPVPNQELGEAANSISKGTITSPKVGKRECLAKVQVVCYGPRHEIIDCDPPQGMYGQIIADASFDFDMQAGSENKCKDLIQRMDKIGRDNQPPGPGWTFRATVAITENGKIITPYLNRVYYPGGKIQDLQEKLG